MIGVVLAVLASAVAPTADTAQIRCALPRGWNEVVGPAPRYVIFGEMHGTAESAAIFGEAACALAERREKLLVAVELGDNAGLQRAWALPHAKFALSLPALMPEWKDREDGVTSQAMFAMLIRLHALKSSGRSIDIVAFNGAPDDTQKTRFKNLPGQGAHEATQADNIRRADAARPHNRVLILVGSFHARKKPLTLGGPTYDPMAMRLAPKDRIASLFMTYTAGTSWNCQLKGSLPANGRVTSDMVDCGVHGGPGNVDRSGAPRLVATAVPNDASNPDGAYDAAYFVGPITASPPLDRTK